MLRPFLALLLLAPAAPAALPPDHATRMERGLATFRKSVRAILADQCLKCHGGEKTKGDFDLATREDLLRGGAEGQAVVPFDPAASRLLRLVRHEEEPHMPGNAPALDAEAVAALTSWIADGAPYEAPLVAGRKPARDKSAVTDDDRQWWAFRPLADVAPPAPGHPVDAFLSAAAAAKGLTLADPAPPAVLLRRAHLVLTGLPPSPEAVAAFTADPSPAAWQRAVDSLLASPAYAERWARHWLDVARFAESSGFEHDYDREGAWHYRDWVIRALHADMPWTQFLTWQLAGDEVAPDDAQALMATGFLGAGVFPTQITANEVERTRYDAMDDMLSTTGSAFLGLTIGCARCHDHKFDPIPARDYYRLLSTFTTTTRSVVELETDPDKTAAERAVWEKQLADIDGKLRRRESALAPAFAQWLQSGAPDAPRPSWQVLAPQSLVSAGGAAFTALPDGSWRAGGANPADDTYTFTTRTVDGPVAALRLEALADPSLKHGGPGRADNGNFALSRIRLFARPAAGGDEREITLSNPASDFQQNAGSLSIAASLDGDPKSGWAVDPQFGRDHAAAFGLAEPLPAGGHVLRVVMEFMVNTRHAIGRPRLSVSAVADAPLTEEALPAEAAAALVRARTSRDSLTEAERAALFTWWKRRDAEFVRLAEQRGRTESQRPRQTARVLVCGEGFPPLRMHSQGADFFNETYYLKRGSTDLKDGVAAPGFLQVLMPAGADPARWQAPPPAGAKFSNRRRALAAWLVDTEQGAGALTARVAVNRVWQHHFGRGIVASSNDFGRTGSLPSHPELLDWLAREFIRNGWRLKPLHRLLLTSAAWRQISARDAAREAADPDNTTFTRFVPRRLEAEALRDSLLAVSGVLDPAMFGRGTRDENSRRRSIYFTIKRSQLVGSMVAFDLPEPLVSQGQRPVTTVAPQALVLMNSPQARTWAQAFAERLRREAPESDDARIVRAHLLALGRPPSLPERERCAAFLAAGGPDALADLCQVILGLNGLAYID